MTTENAFIIFVHSSCVFFVEISVQSVVISKDVFFHENISGVQLC